MRFLPLTLIAVLGGIAGTSGLFAQSKPVDSWEDIIAKQPSALHLKLALAKDQFFQGEKIEAALEFVNNSAAVPYSLQIGAGSPGAVFSANDEKGRAVEDPFLWYRRWNGIVVSGPVAQKILGGYSLVLPVNEGLFFDKPGTYTLYARAMVKERASWDGTNFRSLVSDKLTLTILPLPPEKEEVFIAAALKKIGTAESAGEGVTELAYLQTSRARDELIALLANPELSGRVSHEMLAIQDPAGTAAQILRTVQAGKLVLDSNGAELYGSLKSAVFAGKIQPGDIPEEEAQGIFDKMRKARESGRKEVLDAAIQASGGNPRIEALWASFLEEAVHKNSDDQDSDGGKARKAVAEHQLELSSAHVKSLLDAWDVWGSAEFLPLIRREADLPVNNLVALIALAGLKPEEARPRIVKDLTLSEPRLFETSYPSSSLLPSIAPMPLPQFDSLFRSELTEAKGDAFPIIPVIGCFGSKALLPDVIQSWKTYGKDQKTRWDDGVLKNLFLYWLRCDPPGGALALEQEIQSRGKDGWAFFLDVLGNPWTDNGLPVAKWALKSSDANLVSEGIYLLEKHGDRSWIDPVLDTLETMRKTDEEKKVAYYQARQLLKSERWHFSDQQKHRLEILAEGTRSK